MNGTGRGLALYVLIIAAVFIVILSVSNTWQAQDTYTYEQFINDVDNENVRAIVVRP